MGLVCKICGAKVFVKNGRVRNQQRYLCKSCGVNNIPGDKREKLNLEGKLLAALLSGKGKMSSRSISELLDVSHVAVINCVKKLNAQTLEHTDQLPLKKIDPKEITKFISEKNGLHKNTEKWLVCELHPSDDLVGFILLKPKKKTKTVSTE